MNINQSPEAIVEELRRAVDMKISNLELSLRATRETSDAWNWALDVLQHRVKRIQQDPHLFRIDHAVDGITLEAHQAVRALPSNECSRATSILLGFAAWINRWYQDNWHGWHEVHELRDTLKSKKDELVREKETVERLKKDKSNQDRTLALFMEESRKLKAENKRLKGIVASIKVKLEEPDIKQEE